jgi:hypothetical protein
VEVPLPPRRPAAFAALQAATPTLAAAPAQAGIGQAAAVQHPTPADLAAVSLTPQAPASQAAATQGTATQGTAAHGTATQAVAEAVEVPLPPRRPTAQRLAAIARPAAPKATAATAVLEATALPPTR